MVDDFWSPYWSGRTSLLRDMRYVPHSRRGADSRNLVRREQQVDGQLVLEFTFEQTKMRTIAFDQKAAQKMLGDNLAEAFLSLVADMRNANYISELVDPPANVKSPPVILEYKLDANCIIEVQPIGVHEVNIMNWETTHRVKLVRIVQNGTQII
jgi:hypothetical protein